jgi:hypothetical protein
MEKCRLGAIDTEAAALVLQDAEHAFEEKDYTTALKLAVRCKNLLVTEEGSLETIPPDEEVIERLRRVPGHWRQLLQEMRCEDPKSGRM